MPWPTPQDYFLAIQSPNLCFTDPELRAGILKTGAMGLPSPYTGGFACVYELHLAGGKGKWAVRCFLGAVADQQRRYAEISRALGAANLPYTIKFRYQPAGIRVNGRLLPLVDMEWLTGDLLGEYVQRNLGNSARIGQLAQKWAAMIAALRAKQIAHGDLQHGNIILVNDEIRLIDYDGMYVPALSGLPSIEGGNRNYQHPKRGGLFGPNVDNFSAWLIYASLRILEVAPDTYSFSRDLGRDNCLIFSSEDLERPAVSPLFGSLRLHPEQIVVKASSFIERLLKLEPTSLPDLDPKEFGEAKTVQVITGSAASDWWKDSVVAKGPKITSLPPTAAEVVEEIEEVAEFNDNPRAKIEMLWFIGAACALVILDRKTAMFGMIGLPMVQLVIGSGAVFRLRKYYLACPEAARRERLLQEYVLMTEKHEKQCKRRADLATEIGNLSDDLGGRTNRLQAARTELGRKQALELKDLNISTAQARQQTEAKRKALEKQERDAIDALISAKQAEAQQIASQIANMGAMRVKQLREALAARQKNEAEAFLRRNLVVNALIPGVGGKFKLLLQSKGVQTAADVSYGSVMRIKGFGPVRGKAVVAWREALLNGFAPRISQSLPADEQRSIETALEAQLNALKSRLKATNAAVDNARATTEAKFAALKAQLQREEAMVIGSIQARQDEINRRYSTQIAQLQADVVREREQLIRASASLKAQLATVDFDVRNGESAQKKVSVKLSGLRKITFRRFLGRIFLTSVWPTRLGQEKPVEGPPLQLRIPYLGLTFLAAIALLSSGFEWRNAVLENAPVRPIPFGEIRISSNIPAVEYETVFKAARQKGAAPEPVTGTGDNSSMVLSKPRFGVYEITASAPGWHKPLVRNITFSHEGSIEERFIFGRSNVDITSDPSGANVFEDGRLLGETPLHLEARTTEKHTYILKYLDWDPPSLPVDLSAGQRNISFRWPHGSVHLETDPEGADVVVMGQKVGVTPYDLPTVRLGGVSYDVRLAGYEPIRIEGVVEEGRRLSFARELIDVVRNPIVEVKTGGDPHTITVENMDSNPVKIFAVNLYSADHRLKEAINGPWVLSMGNEITATFKQPQEATDLVTFDSNPKHLNPTFVDTKAVAAALEAARVSKNGLPDAPLLPGALLTLIVHTKQLEIKNTGGVDLFVRAVRIKFKAFWKSETSIPIGRLIPPGGRFSTQIKQTLKEGDTIEFMTEPALDRTHSTVEIRE